MQCLLQQLLIKGIVPSTVKSEDYFDLLTALKARNRDNRPELTDPGDALANFR